MVQRLQLFVLQKLAKLKIKLLILVILAKKTNYNAKISDVEKKYFATFDYNVFMNDILDAKIKQKKWSVNLYF